MRTGVAFGLAHATLRLGGKVLWADLSLSVPNAEFVAVLGPNGTGKTSLLRTLLGLQPLSAGRVEVLGSAPRHGTPLVGYVPQQRAFDPDLTVRGRDLVAMGLNGHRWGFTVRPEPVERRVNEFLELVGARGYADAAIGRLSGGEQQRLRIAQALIGEPRLLLCDEPLLSLDMSSQQTIVQLLAEWSHRRGVTVVFVAHDINPLLGAVDRVLLLAGGRWAFGSVEEVLTSATLTRLYNSPVEVVRLGQRVVVVGAELGGHDHLPEHSAVSQ